MSFSVYFCKEFPSIWGSVIIQLMITLIPWMSLEPLTIWTNFLYFHSLSDYRANWGNQMPVLFEEIGRLLGFEWNTGHLGKAWHFILAWPESPLGSEGWGKFSHLSTMASLPSEGRSAPKPHGSPNKWTLDGWRQAERGFLLTQGRVLAQLRPVEPARSHNHPSQWMQFENKENVPFSPLKLTVKVKKQSQLF